MIALGKLDAGAGELVVDLAEVKHATVTASSGFGKTTGLLVFLERVLALPAKQRPQIVVLDVEGDFAELRAVGDFALVGPDGEAPVDPRTAAALSRLIREKGINLIVDLSDTDAKDREQFVGNFAKGLLHQGRELWGELLLVVDEADVFAPQKIRKDRPSASKDALVSLAARGRKRGIHVVWATQRLAKLEKDVVSESNLRLVGHQNEKSDRKRAQEDLEDYAEGNIDWTREIVKLQEGDFFVYGNAMGDQVLRARLDLPKTQPPATGAAAKPPPPAKGAVAAAIREIFADLPHRADAEAESIEEAQATIARLQAEIRALQKRGPGAGAAVKIVDEKAIERAVAAATKELEREIHAVRAQNAKLHRKAHDALERLAVQANDAREAIGELVVPEAAEAAKRAKPTAAAPTSTPAPRPTSTTAEGLTNAQQHVVDALAKLRAIGHDPAPRDMLHAISGYSKTASTLGVYLSQLSASGHVDTTQRGLVRLTDQGLLAANVVEPPRTWSELRALLRAGTLSDADLSVLDKIRDAGGDWMKRDELHELTGYSKTASTLGVYLSNLGAQGLIETRRGEVRLVDWVRELAEGD